VLSLIFHNSLKTQLCLSLSQFPHLLGLGCRHLEDFLTITRVTPENHPKSLNEGVPPYIAPMGGTPNARNPPNMFPMLKSNRTAARNNSKRNNTYPPLPKSQKQHSMVARSRGGDRSTKCHSGGRKAKPHRPVTSQKLEMPAGTGIAERSHRRVPGLGGATEDESAGDPINQALVPSIRSTQGRQRKYLNDYRVATIECRLGSTPQIQNRQLANRRRLPVPEPSSDVRGCGGYIELLLTTRTAPLRGEMDQDQVIEGRFTVESPAFRFTLLPAIERGAWPKEWKRHCATTEFT